MTNTQNPPKKIYLKDYKSPAFAVQNIELYFNILDDRCEVRAKIELEKIDPAAKDLLLDGEELELMDVKLNGQTPRFDTSEQGLKIYDVPARFTLNTVVKIDPAKNTALSGLYKSGEILTTQCEAQGFRRITYFLDRPDVMTKYRVSIEADQKKYPVLLSNGDRVETKNLPDGRHLVTWEDPFKKPAYLFALVAGDLGVLKDTFTTISGRKISLEVYATHGTQDRCLHALESLQKSMRWDEERFGREYDLSTYMIVAADDFNAGAMENKGLNIFNSKLVFADPQTATDMDYFRIESVVAHEYFHNWTGNRVTLRDWFHLSLKEGLTVFRDQEFSMDMSSRGLIRIENVNDLRSHQFSEDAGPNAHPIRPESCFAVDNFYTATIYEKGAEVIRMMQTMVGRPGFRKGMDNYFNLHDGQAVIIEDFAKAIALPNKQDWEQFQLWYSQAGTPQVTAQEKYDAQAQTYTLTLTQSCPLTAQEKIQGLDKKPFHIPLIVGLLNKNGEEITLSCDKAALNSEGQTLLHLKAASESFVFKGVKEKPVLSLNRQFSAPIHLSTPANDDELLFLMKKDTDSFNRWEASQKIYQKTFSNLIDADQKNQTLAVPEQMTDAFATLLDDSLLDADMKAKLMTLPSDDYLAQLEATLHTQSFHRARQKMKTDFARKTEKQLLAIYDAHHGKNILSKDARDFGKRRLKNTALSYLSQLTAHQKLVEKQFLDAKIMTDQISAFSLMLEMDNNLRQMAIDKFFDQWKNEYLVLNKWLAAQASSHHPKTFETVVQLASHKAFSIKNPNNVYALLRAFGANLVRFHDTAHDTYHFMGEKILELDKLNPQVAARIAGCFDVWTKLPTPLKDKVHVVLQKLVASGLSKNTHEIISKNLEALT
jgi:aminopeptidase N